LLARAYALVSRAIARFFYGNQGEFKHF